MRILIAAVVMVLFFSGCNHQPSFSNIILPTYDNISNKERRLFKRFSEYWHYRLIKDFDRTYSYELPYQRYLIDKSTYKGLLDGYGEDTKVQLLKITFLSPDVAIIQRKIITKANTLTGKDKWIYVNGEWYHKFFQNILPPKNKEEAEFQ